MRGNSHVRCGAGENLEIISKSYLSLKMSTLRNCPQGWHTSFGRIFKSEVAGRFGGIVVQELCAENGDIDDFLFRFLEDLLTLGDRGGII